MFSKIFIERPRFAIVISLVMVLAGIICLYKLPIAEYPEITPPQLYVSTSYSGASAEVIAQTVAMPLEDQINGVDDLLYFSSTCDNSGNYTCTVTFKSGTDSDIAMVNLQNAIKRAESKLPSEVTKVGISVEKRGSDMLAVFAFMTDGTSMSLMELNNYVSTNISDAVQRIEGVSSSDVMSAMEYSMRIWLDPIRMSGLGISTADISTAVESQNIQAAAGSIGAESSNQLVTYKLNVQGRLKTAEEFENIILRRGDDGSIIRLRDVAKVEVGSSSYSGTSKCDGKEVVAIGIYRSPEANALSTVENVKAELDEWQKRFPEGVSYSIPYDPTQFIEISLKEIIQTLLIALGLVVLITWLFLQDWRATLVPSVAIPVSLVGTFSFLYALDFSINLLTMFGLILVIGSLCDDAIVVVENCQSLMQREGLSARDAAVKCMGQITGAVIATTLVTVACYIPLAFYGGMVGSIYVQFAVTMCIALCLSTVVALTLSPALCALLLRKPAEEHGMIFKPVNFALDCSRSVYSVCVGFLVRRAILTVVLFAGVLFGVYSLFDRVDSSFLPSEDKGAIMCNIELPSGASLARTDKVIEEFSKILEDTGGVDSILTVTGMSMMSGQGENVAMCIVELEPWDKRTSKETQLNAIMQEVQAKSTKIADASITCFTPPAIMGLGITGGASFQLCGIGDADTRQLSDTTKSFTRQLSARPETLYAMSSFSADTPQIYLDIDREKSETLGVEISDIYSNLQCKLASLYINDFTMMNQNYKVKMQSGASYRSTLDDVREIQVKNSDGYMVPLSSLGILRYMVGPQQITRFNKMSSAEVNAQSASGVSSRSLINLIENMELPDSYHVEWTGLSYQEKQNEGQIVYLMALAMVFAYFFLVAQYESWTIPVPVMLAVAFAILGALIGLLVTGETLSIYAQLGMVMLIGLAAKNAILMVEFSKTEREQGKSIVEAALDGANLRYRAVLMTAFSFLFGVFPMVIASGAGSGSRRAIGITTFSGMLLATLVGIVFTPALYAVFQRLREYVKGVLHLRRTTSYGQSRDEK